MHIFRAAALIFAASVIFETPRASAQSAVERQRASAEAQIASVERQRGAVRTQRQSVARTLNSAAPETGFFELPGLDTASSVAADNACEPVSAMRLDSIIERAALRENIPSSLIRAVIQQESAGVPCAVSVKGAQGLMQLMPGTAADLGVSDAMDPEQNVAGGAKLLGQLMREYKNDLNRALAAYNAGRKNVEEAGGVPNFPETIHYVQQILSHLGFLDAAREPR